MVEVHPDPDSALSDSEQQLTIEQFEDLMGDLVAVHEHVRGLHDGAPSVVADVGATSDGLSKH
jgi:3-deoxy-D-manno-octulosonic acid (KDO) 8-phosphate synthase